MKIVKKQFIDDNRNYYDLSIADTHNFCLAGGEVVHNTGVGFSVQKHHVESLPEIRKPSLGKTRRFLVGDSIEGWADAVSVLVKAYFQGGSKPAFDFRDIRPKGARLVTSGGKAPGPQPLKECLIKIEGILDSKNNGDRLAPIEVHDIVCHIADAVLAGGIRRAALISLFSATDEDMLSCKTGSWWEKNPQRGRANNSIVLIRHKITKEYFMDLWKRVEKSGSGEPGIFLSNDKDWGTNPCLTGETQVAVADGRGYVSFKELADEGKDVPVFTLDENGIVRSAIMRRPRMTGENVAVYKITMDDGNIIRATENHKFPLKNGDIKTVGELVVGDSLRTMVKFDSQLWDNKNSQKYTFIRSGKNTRAEHRIIAEHYHNIDLVGNSNETTVHHIDNNGKNNSPENLQVMSVEEHNRLHVDRMLGKNNPIHQILSSEYADEYKKKISEATSAENNPNYSGITNEELYNHARWLTMALGHPASTADWGSYAKEKGLPLSFSGWRKTHLGGISGFLRKAAIECGMITYDTTDIRIVKALYYYLSQGYDCFIDENTGKLLFNKVCEYSGEHFITEIPEASVKHEYAREHNAKMQWASHRASMLNSINNSHTIRKSIIREKQASIYNDLKFTIGREPNKNEWITKCGINGLSAEISRESSPFRTYNDLKEYAATSNHKVISVEFDGYESVYNGTVDGNHNFFIGAFDNSGKTISINTMNCAEISLRPFQFCNLCEINVSDVVNQDDLNARAKAASFIATLQGGYTEFHYLRPIWQRTTEKDALIGVSMTGIASGAVLTLDTKDAARVVREENKRVAELIGINVAARTTTVKPAGSTSLTLGTSSGVHAWHNQYYIRRIRVGKNEAIYSYLSLNHPELLEDEFFRPHDTAIISVPQRAPEHAIFRTESPIQLLERVKKIHKEWIKPGHRSGNNTHNVSATISVREHEWAAVGQWFWDNREYYNGLSVLPFDGGNYVQSPFEDCTEEKYNELVQRLHSIDLSNIIELDDTTHVSAELACSGGVCTVNEM
jgi:intein/homing endonuclease